MAQTAYHVAPQDHTGDLISAYEIHGDAAYDIYAARWADVPEIASLAQNHAHYVHMFDDLDAARQFAAGLTSSTKIYEIDLEAMIDNCYNVVRDQAEFDHPMVRDQIEAEYISLVA